MICRPCLFFNGCSRTTARVFKRKGLCMDLQYLLLLQQLRNSAGAWLTSLMILISGFAAQGSALLCIAVFWGFDRDFGYWLITNCISSTFFNNVLKLTACVYRPWIRCPELTPPAAALESATGYSFPSAHTQLASAFWGSVAIKKGKDNKKITALCIAMILLAAFSRNFLGIHTPQDVLAAMAASALILYINIRLFDRLTGDRSFLYKAIAVVIACIIYIAVKPYPMDYIDGALVVDPEMMKEDGYAIAGGALGFLTGTFLEVRYIRFTTEGTLTKRIIRLIMGIPAALLIMLVFRNAVYSLIGKAAGHVVVYAVLAFYIIAVYPAVFTAVEKRLRKQNP